MTEKRELDRETERDIETGRETYGQVERERHVRDM